MPEGQPGHTCRQMTQVLAQRRCFGKQEGSLADGHSGDVDQGINFLALGGVSYVCVSEIVFVVRPAPGQTDAGSLACYALS